MNDVVPGSPDYYPARVPGPFAGVVHLARAEARKDADPVLFAVCPGGRRLGALVPAERQTRLQRWAQGERQWCDDCRRFRDYLRQMAVRERRRQGEK